MIEGLKDLHADPHMLHDVTTSACAAELELAQMCKRKQKPSSPRETSDTMDDG